MKQLAGFIFSVCFILCSYQSASGNSITYDFVGVIDTPSEWGGMPTGQAELGIKEGDEFSGSLTYSYTSGVPNNSNDPSVGAYEACVDFIVDFKGFVVKSTFTRLYRYAFPEPAGMEVWGYNSSDNNADFDVEYIIFNFGSAEATSGAVSLPTVEEFGLYDLRDVYIAGLVGGEIVLTEWMGGPSQRCPTDPVPEPATALLVSAGVASFVTIRRKNKKQLLT